MDIDIPSGHIYEPHKYRKHSSRLPRWGAEFPATATHLPISAVTMCRMGTGLPLPLLLPDRLRIGGEDWATTVYALPLGTEFPTMRTAFVELRFNRHDGLGAGEVGGHHLNPVRC